MSHKDYIDTCDEDQLRCLVEMSQARIRQIQESGFVTLWAVGDDFVNRAWFPLDQHGAALGKMIELARADHKDGVECKWDITKVKVRPEEAERLLKDG